MNRRLLYVAASAIMAAAAIVICRNTPTKAQPLIKPNGTLVRPQASPLPITQVILFNSGVAYFQREGEVEESTRVDLTFPADDINDLLKSLVLQDMGGGKISAINYDSHDPIEKTLKSFALDLTNNPTFGQLLNQARGEKIEVTMEPGNSSSSGLLTGAIVGMESQAQPAGKDVVEVHLLNLLCAEGMRSVPMSHVQRVRFLNPILEGEFKRALEVLASTHDTQKKTVSLGFTGEGKRTVRVGYVVENPIWKTSYRLVLDQDGKPFLQGWAVVENTSDDDWNNVAMVLVSGRPISFQMNLYQPLYIPRPTVEPELFASLRPPTYNGALLNPGNPVAQDVTILNGPPAAGLAGNGAAQNLAFQGQGGGFQGQGLGFQSGQNQATNFAFMNRYQLNNQLGLQNGQVGNQGGQMGQVGNNNFDQNPRLTYEELQRRRQQLQAGRDGAVKLGSQLAGLNPTEGISSVASAQEIGDYYQYRIDQRVSLPRQKSALLPIINGPVEAAKVSIFNEGVHPKFPLLGLRFKNTSGQNLTQGPITVYEGGSYAGDARVMDLQPNEERLLSYAIDLGTEVKAEAKTAPENLTAVKIVKGVLQATHKLRETKTYLVKNHADHDRVLLIEHPFRADWKLVAPEKSDERSRDVYRFQLAVPAGKTARQEVVEEQSRVSPIALSASDDQTVRVYVNSEVSSPKVKEALNKAMEFRTRLSDTQRELAQGEAQLKAITEDQVRLRANFERLPPTSAAYKRYLEKFDTQETEIEKLQAQIKQLQETEKQQKKEYEDFLAGLSVE